MNPLGILLAVLLTVVVYIVLDRLTDPTIAIVGAILVLVVGILGAGGVGERMGGFRRRP